MAYMKQVKENMSRITHLVVANILKGECDFLQHPAKKIIIYTIELMPIYANNIRC